MPDDDSSTPCLCEEPDDADTGAGRGTELLVGTLLLGAMACAIGFAIVYALGGQIQIEGVLLAGAFVLLAVALGIWAKHFMPQGPYQQSRPVLESSSNERKMVADAFMAGERTIVSRRALSALVVGAAGSIGVALLFPLRSLGNSMLPELRRTAWRTGARLVDADGNPIRSLDLEVDTLTTVFPEGSSEKDREDSQTLLLRLSPGILAPHGHNPHEELADVVAFSKVCTHAGCPVGQYQAETHLLVCPCHQSLFDVTERAKPVFGPATRPLPQLPLTIEDGFIVAADDYPGPVGPAFWSWGRN